MSSFLVIQVVIIVVSFVGGRLYRMARRRELARLNEQIEQEKAALLVLRAKLTAVSKARDMARNPKRHQEWS